MFKMPFIFKTPFNNSLVPVLCLFLDVLRGYACQLVVIVVFALSITCLMLILS